MTKSEVDALRFNVKRPFRPVLKDAFLDALMELFYIRNFVRNGARPKKTARLLKPVAERLGLDQCQKASPEDRALFIEAYRDTAMLFIDLGKDDHAYSTGIMNLTHLSDEKFKRKVRSDFSDIGTKLPEFAGLGELFLPFREGLETAYKKYFREEENNAEV